MRSLAAPERVTILAIEGWCVGGGMALVTGVDRRVASASAQRYVPEIERGMNMSGQSIPCWVSLIGAPRTRRMTLLAERVAALPLVQVRLCKEGINLASGALHRALSTMDRDQFVLAQSSDGYQEGVRSFLEKRPPVFRGR